MSAHPAYCQQLRDEISELIEAAQRRDGVTASQAQRVLFDLAKNMTPEPLPLRGEADQGE